jgi:hypothetical protein
MKRAMNRRIGLMAGVGMGLLCASAAGHITLLDPNGGEEILAGSSFSMSWRIDIRHNQQNWDIWYSTTGPDSDWIEVAVDLDPGATNAGSIHNFDWTVPDILAENVWVRVRMDNVGTDYFDVSNSSFAIVPGPGVVSLLAVGSLAGIRRRR